MEKWIRTGERMPELDTPVLVLASGNPHKYVTLRDSYQIAEYTPDGWIVDEFPEWEGAQVSFWMPLPEAPEEVSHEF